MATKTFVQLLVPLVAFGVCEYFQYVAINGAHLQFLPSSITSPLECTTPYVGEGYSNAEVCAQLFQSQFLYAAFWLLNAVSSIAAGLIAYSIIHSTFGASNTDGRWAAIGVALLVGVAISTRFWLGSNKYGEIVDQLLPNSVANMLPLGIDTLLNITNTVVAFSATLVAVACLVTIQDLPLATADSTQNLAQLSERMQALRRAITAGAMILVSGVLVTQAYLKLPTAYLHSFAESTSTTTPVIEHGFPPHAMTARLTVPSMSSLSATRGESAHKNFVDGLVTFQGIEYTLVLLILFIFPAIRIRHVAIEIAGSANLAAKQAGKGATGTVAPAASGQTTASYVSPTKLIEQFGLSFSLPTFLVDLLSVAAPAIATSLTPLVKIASGA